ncbi:MAG: type IX secretion system membrane protein PorP/SprF [Saprospiraceae bacterium]|nr:type IX secretion system membrane protein PorP/SprF [Saprospiraceae bacterium]
MNKFLPFILCLCLFGSEKLFSQDPVFSQFYAAPLQINPAFAGNTLAPRIALNYRNQWPSLTGGYVTYAASYEQLFEPLNSGLGLMVQADDAGDGTYKSTNFGLTYAYRLTFGNNFFAKIGVEVGGAQISLDWDRLIFADQIDPINGPTGPGGITNPSGEIRPDDLNKTYFDISTGMLLYSPNFYFGFSAKHLNTPDQTLLNTNDQLTSGLPIRWTVHGGTQIPITSGSRNSFPVFISPNLAFIKQGDFGQIDGGAYVGFGMFFAGAWYRYAFTNGDAVIGTIGIQKDIFKIGYSMDFTVSDLAMEGTGGAHEISLILNFENSETFQRKRRSSRFNDCFQLFR